MNKEKPDWFWHSYNGVFVRINPDNLEEWSESSKSFALYQGRRKTIGYYFGIRALADKIINERLK